MALFNAEMKDNEANTRQNNGKNLYMNGNCFSQLMIVIGAKLFNRRLTQIDADSRFAIFFLARRAWPINCLRSSASVGG